MLQCKHITQKKYKDRGIYIYDLPDKQALWLCPDCNMVLAGKVMQQLATEVFLDTQSMANGCWDKNYLMVKTSKEVKNVRGKKRRSGKAERKESKN